MSKENYFIPTTTCNLLQVSNHFQSRTPWLYVGQVLHRPVLISLTHGMSSSILRKKKGMQKLLCIPWAFIMEGTQWARARKSSLGVNCRGKFRQPHCSALQHRMTILFKYSAHSKNCRARLWHKTYYFYMNKIVIFPYKTTWNNFQNYLIEKCMKKWP